VKKPKSHGSQNRLLSQMIFLIVFRDTLAALVKSKKR